MARADEIRIDSGEEFFVLLAQGQFKHLAAIGEARGELVHGRDDGFQGRPFATQLLGLFGVVPDDRVFQLSLNFL
jgi:hypothetical protein